MNRRELWERFRKYQCAVPSLGLTLDVSRMHFDEDALAQMAEPMSHALDAMDALEKGAIANADEQRPVGHYWLRAPELAPDPGIRDDIRQAIRDIKQFATDVHEGAIAPQHADGFYIVLLVGIGGSALGPQFVADALGISEDRMIIRYVDNTDPDGIDRTLAELAESLDETLTIVVSKSGTTKETRNGMVEVAAAYERAGLSFAEHAVAVTTEGSVLFEQAARERWVRTFPMWDFVGGRTSVTSAVGLLPAALQGLDVDAFLAGARECDVATRSREPMKNPAAIMSFMWHLAGNGRGERNLVVLPYKDRLALLGKYLQQLVMESLGKALDRSGRTVHQGLTVFGNKGSTDQHSFVQQLREGPDDFLVTFITVLKDRDEASVDVEPDVTPGDYLHAFWQGTRAALFENGRQSMTITVDELSARTVGALIALFERTVGLYAELIDVNAYHQPGVEAGKKAAGAVLELQRKALAHLREAGGAPQSAEQIAEAIEEQERVEDVYHVLRHASANPDHGIVCREDRWRIRNGES